MEIEAPVDGLLFTCITHQSEKEISHKGNEKEVSIKVKNYIEKQTGCFMPYLEAQCHSSFCSISTLSLKTKELVTYIGN